MFQILIAAVLVGPPINSAPTLTLRIHLGRDQRSRVARHELENRHPWWITHRIAIAQHYRLVVDDEANEFPCYQIGHGPREPFVPGSCAASGSFIRSLRSIAENDAWEREFPVSTSGEYMDGQYIATRNEDKRPEVFPPGAQNGR